MHAQSAKMRPIVTDVPCLLDITMTCAKIAEPIEMPY